jgi:glycine betaine catabolism B
LRKHFYTSFFIPVLAAFLIPAASSSSVALAQTAPDEHEQHHPQQQMSPMPSPPAANTNSNANSNINSSGGMTGGMSNGGTSGGMSGGMGDMMKQMGAPPPKELYPSLMNVPPDLPPEKRDEIKKLADERIAEGNALVSSGFAKLAGANQKQDFAAMREGSEEIRRGQTLLESER